MTWAGGTPSPPADSGSRLLITSRPWSSCATVKFCSSTVRSACTAGSSRAQGGAASSQQADTRARPSRAYSTISLSRSAFPAGSRQESIRAP